MSECYVSAADYARYWAPKQVRGVLDVPFEPVTIVEDRRIAMCDRRAPAHDRRWEQSRGRRFRLSDRRKGKA